MSAGLSTPGTFTIVSSRRVTASCTHKTWAWTCLTRPPLRALRQSPLTLWRPHVHVVLPLLPCQQPMPLRTERSMHSLSTRRTPLHLSLAPPHFELLPTLQGDAQQASRTKTKSTVGSSHTLPSRRLRRRPRLAVQLVCCTRPSISGFPSGIAPDVRGLVLDVRLLHPSRKFLHCELQLTPVLTEIAGPHRPRPVASSILCTQLLAIFFISRPHSFAFLAQSHLWHQDFHVSRVGLELLRLEDTVSTVHSGGLLVAHRPFQHWVPSQLSS